jgi:tRNA pseudouridine55 synthase
MTEAKLSNIILIDKPKGITSYDVIRRLQKQFGKLKMGHAGTLDPAATGLMIIGVAEGTKQLATFLGLSKTYEAGILLGKRTKTGDLDGEIVEEKAVPDLKKEDIEEVLKNLIGKIKLPVPAYSAIKKNGRPLYSYAHKGEVIEPPIKEMEIRDAVYLSRTNDTITVFFDVKSGTYIRSIAEEIGRKLGTVATLKNLRRTTIGEFRVEDAQKLV